MSQGINYRTLMNKLGVKNGVLSYHLGILEKTSIIKSKNGSITEQTFYPADIKSNKREKFTLTDTQIKIINVIKEKPGISQKEISLKLRLKMKILKNNVRSLKKARKLKKKW